MAAIRLTVVGTTGVSRRITTIMITWQTFGIDDDSGFSNLSGIHHDKSWQLRKEQNSSSLDVVDLTRLASYSARCGPKCKIYAKPSKISFPIT
uniref:Secreted protein n=1 Tax=Panagrellus redivivus TaxID=6233 RepID=A0A7E4ZW32_PANRE